MLTRPYLDGRLVHSRGRFVDRKGRPLPGCDRPVGSHATAPYFPRGTDAVNIIINLAVSEPKGYCKGPKGSVNWPVGTALEVDHVRVYQRRPQSGLVDLCKATRKVMPIDSAAAPIRQGEVRSYVLSGDPAAVRWSCSNGLSIVGTEGNTVRVQLKKGIRTEQWLNAEIGEEPCSAGPLAPRVAVAVLR